MTKKMQDYINEAHSIALKNIDNRNALTEELVNIYIEKKPERLWIVASGSSFNSSMCALPYVKKNLNSEVKVISPLAFSQYAIEELGENDLVFVVSQTGYSTNALSALDSIGKKGLLRIGLTGDVDSDFKNHTDLVIDYGLDGIETVGYVTKGVITLVTFLMLFSLGVRSKLTHVDLTEEVEELKFALSSHPEIINKTEQFIKNHWISILGTQTSYFCGVNANYGTALEAALKFGETVLVPSIAFELEEYIHGPNLQLSPNYTVFIFGNGDHTNERSATIYEATKKVSDDVYYITSNQKFEGYDGNTLVVPHVSEEVNPLVFLPVIQTIAAQVSGFLSRKQHSLLSEFKDIAKSKSDNYVDND